MNSEMLEKYLRNSVLIQTETGTYDDFFELCQNPTEDNLVLIFMLGYFAANQFYTDKIRELLNERKLEFKLSDVHEIVKEISRKPLE